MKKNIIFAAAAAASALLLSVSCTKTVQSETAGKGKTFTAVIEEEITRTSLTKDLSVNWKAGDRISINGAEYSAIPKEPATMALFQPVESDAVKDSKDGYTAIYPSSLVSKDGSWWLPEVQKYEVGCLNAPMFAQSSTEKLHFKNICGVLKISLTGNYTVNRITVRTNGDNVWGLFGVIDNRVNLYGGGDTSVALDCGKDGVQLSSNEATDFFIYLPPKQYAPGVTISVMTSDGSEFKKTIVKPIEIYRNTLYPIEWNLLPSVNEALSKFFTDFAADQAKLSAATDEATGGNAKNFFLPEIHTWENACTAIKSIDNALEQLEVEEIEDKQKMQQRGELNFFKSLLYFELFRTYGKAPFMDDTYQTLRPSEEVFQIITKYAMEAKDQLPSSYDDADRIITLDKNVQVTRPTRWAALALMARASLYAASPLFDIESYKRWNETNNYCAEIINSGIFALMPQYSDLWGQNAFNNKELIFGVRFTTPSGAYDGIHPTQMLFKQFNSSDSRLASTIEQSSNVLNLVKPVAQVMPISRYADILLTCAEASIKTGNQAMADSYFNNLRQRAQLNVFSQVTQENIENERILELAFEGHRFWDARRWMKGKVFEDIDGYHRTWDDSYYFFPIPGSTNIDVLKK